MPWGRVRQCLCASCLHSWKQMFASVTFEGCFISEKWKESLMGWSLLGEIIWHSEYILTTTTTTSPTPPFILAKTVVTLSINKINICTFKMMFGELYGNCILQPWAESRWNVCIVALAGSLQALPPFHFHLGRRSLTLRRAEDFDMTSRPLCLLQFLWGALRAVS